MDSVISVLVCIYMTEDNKDLLGQRLLIAYYDVDLKKER